jgi:hypothetical protein
MKIKEEQTGIFILRTTTVENWKESKRMLLAMTKEDPLDDLLKCEDMAKGILRANGFADWRDVPKSAAILARDARELILAVMVTQNWIKKNDAIKAAASAFRAGHIATRIMVRPAEKSAVIGQKVRGGGLKGSNTRSADYESARKEWQRWKVYAKQIPEDEKLSQREIADRVADHFCVASETVRKALRKLAK